MLPLRDHLPTRSAAVVNILLIGLNTTPGAPGVAW